MDYQPYDQQINNTPSNSGQAFETAAFVLGIIAFATSCCLYTSLICGALAILFAFLSRGSRRTMSSRALIALWLGVAAIACTAMFYGISYYTMIREYGSIEGVLQEYSRLTGIDYDTLYQMVYPQ